MRRASLASVDQAVSAFRDQPVVGRLTDDLVDIYRDLREGSTRR